jgi:hypothetical protein
MNRKGAKAQRNTKGFWVLTLRLRAFAVNELRFEI